MATRSRLLASDIVVATAFTALGLVELALVRPQGWPYGVVIVLVVGALLSGIAGTRWSSRPAPSSSSC